MAMNKTELMEMIRSTIVSNSSKSINAQSLGNVLTEIADTASSSNGSGDGLLRIKFIDPLFLDLFMVLEDINEETITNTPNEIFEYLGEEYRQPYIQWIKDAMEHNSEMYKKIVEKRSLNEGISVILDYSESFSLTYKLMMLLELGVDYDSILLNMSFSQLAMTQSIKSNFPMEGFDDMVMLAAIPLHEDLGMFNGSEEIILNNDGSFRISGFDSTSYYLYLDEDNISSYVGDNIRTLKYICEDYGDINKVSIRNGDTLKLGNSNYVAEIIPLSYASTSSDGGHFALTYFKGKTLKQAVFNGTETGIPTITDVE